VHYRPLTVNFLRAVVLALSLVVGPQAGAGDERDKAVDYAWQQLIEALQLRRDQLSSSMEKARDALLLRAQVENPDFIARLYLARPRRSGYQNIPALKDNPPLALIMPRQQTYSLEELQQRYQQHLPAAADLYQQAIAKPSSDLAPQVVEFERLRWQLRNMEKHLAYHVQWQRAAVEQRAFFAQRNRIAASIREMRALDKNGGSDERIAALRWGIDERVGEFDRTAGLAIQIDGNDRRILPVEVYTDIDDEAFLQAFLEAVEEAFSDSAAAQKLGFTVSLHFHRISAAELYPQGVPARGSTINIKQHCALFPKDVLILTTGAASTHAWVGRSITLGPNPTTRRTLAHEFGHLLGFSDAYLRSFKGDSQDPYGVVLHEWTGLVDNLMGSPGSGRVTEGMIETLLDAYGKD